MWEERRGEWVRQLEEYLGEVGVEIGELRSMSKVKFKVHAWDEARWRQELNMTETLEIYRNKSKIHEERIYNNSFGSVILFRCYTNTLKLNFEKISGRRGGVSPVWGVGGGDIGPFSETV